MTTTAAPSSLAQPIAEAQQVPHPYERQCRVWRVVVLGVPITAFDLKTPGSIAMVVGRINAAAVEQGVTVGGELVLGEVS